MKERRREREERAARDGQRDIDYERGRKREGWRERKTERENKGGIQREKMKDLDPS